MQALDLYASIEQYLDFEEEVHELYKVIAHNVISREPKTLIDIGCGQGYFCHIMNHNGIDAIGIDKSAKQIEIATEKGINTKCIDIKDVKEKYDCATAVFDVINYIPEDYLKSFLTHTYNVLNNGGHFIFDINSLYGFEEIATGTLNIDVDDKFIAIDANFKDQKLYTDITIFTKDGKLYNRQTGTIEQYYYTNAYLIKLLKDIGFNIEEEININLHGGDEADKYILICKKILI